MAHNPETTVRKIFTLPRDLWERTEDYRFNMRIKTEAEAIRRLMELGLCFQSKEDINKAIVSSAKMILQDYFITANYDLMMQAASAILDLTEVSDEIILKKDEGFRPSSSFVFFSSLSAAPFFVSHGANCFKAAETAVLRAFRETEESGLPDPYEQVHAMIKDGRIYKYNGKNLPGK